MAPRALAVSHYHTSAQQKQKESIGPSYMAQRGQTENMPNNLLQIQNQTALHFASNYTNGRPFVGPSASKRWS